MIDFTAGVCLGAVAIEAGITPLLGLGYVSSEWDNREAVRWVRMMTWLEVMHATQIGNSRWRAPMPTTTTVFRTMAPPVLYRAVREEAARPVVVFWE